MHEDTDPIEQEINRSSPPAPENGDLFALSIGVMLTALGVAGLTYTLVSAYSLLNGGAGFGLFQRLTAQGTGTLSLPQLGSINLPPYFTTIGAYGMVLGLLAVMAGISNAFLKGGIALLKPDVRSLAQELIKEIRRLETTQSKR